jgi:simple sugar transport system ATP-binding protein
LHDVSVEIGHGELVGVAAVEGSGQHELLRVMAGRLKPTRGTAAIPSDIGFIPEDRQRDAVVLEMTLTENLALRGLSARRGRMPWNRLETHAQQLIGAFDVHTSGPRAVLSSLSGGNQQRFVVGRELAPLPAALIVENPTRGLDIRAAAGVHDRLRAARDAGTAIVMYSSDVDEVLALADRVLVVYGGMVRTAPPVRDVVGRAMLGVVDG